MDTVLLQIDGWPGGGKSLLTGLLDGHSEIFSFIVHDASHISFLGYYYNADDWLPEKRTEDLRRLLCSSGYYNIEKEANRGYTEFDFSSSDRIELPFPVDFYQFDKNFIQEVLTLSDWKPDKIVNILYKNLMQELSKNYRKNHPKYFASMGHANLSLQKFFLDVYPLAKTILVKRNIESIVATRSRRKPKKDHTPSMNSYSRPITTQIMNSEIKKILEYFGYWGEMATIFPDRVLIVDFDDINTNTEKTMRKVADFLDIKFEKILCKWTHLGKEFKINGKSYVGKELDDPIQLLTDGEIKIIDKEIKRQRIKLKRRNKSNSLKLSPSVILFSRLFRYFGNRLSEHGF